MRTYKQIQEEKATRLEKYINALKQMYGGPGSGPNPGGGKGDDEGGGKGGAGSAKAPAIKEGKNADGSKTYKSSVRELTNKGDNFLRNGIKEAHGTYEGRVGTFENFKPEGQSKAGGGYAAKNILTTFVEKREDGTIRKTPTTLADKNIKITHVTATPAFSS